MFATPILAQRVPTIPGAADTAWTLVGAGGSGVQTTATKATGGAGVRHVATTITATLASGSTGITVPASPPTVVLRDGAAGAGTIVWRGYLSITTTAGDGAVLSVSDLYIVGTADTAMTLEFSAAGGANSFQSVALTGYDITG